MDDRGGIILVLTQKEYEILNLLWAEGRALTANEIVQLLTDKTWKNSTIHILLNGLIDKQIIRVDGVVQAGRTYARLFVPVISLEEYLIRQIKNTPSYSTDKKSHLLNMISALLNDEDIAVDTLSEIEKLVQEKKELCGSISRKR